MNKSVRLPPGTVQYSPPVRHFRRSEVLADLGTYQREYDYHLSIINPELQNVIDQDRELLQHSTDERLESQEWGGLLIPHIVEKYSVFGWVGSARTVERFAIHRDEVLDGLLEYQRRCFAYALDDDAAKCVRDYGLTFDVMMGVLNGDDEPQSETSSVKEPGEPGSVHASAILGELRNLHRCGGLSRYFAVNMLNRLELKDKPDVIRWELLPPDAQVWYGVRYIERLRDSLRDVITFAAEQKDVPLAKFLAE